MGRRSDRPSWTISSRLVSGGRSTGEGPAKGAPLNVPIVPASNFKLGGTFEYARDDGTPTWLALESLLGGLEGGRAVVFSSGMAAIAAVFDQLATGSTIALPDDCYQGVTGLARRGEELGRFRVVQIPTASTERWIEVLQKADLVWLESPSNPLLVIADIEAICRAKRKPGAILAVDNTFATPLNQQPLELGADVSIQSATKFIGGHSDLLAGAATTRSDAVYEQLRASRLLAGATPGGLECFLATRGLRTMALRLERAQENAGELAGRLAAHPAVELVRYPGLPSHPGFELASQQLRGFGSMLSFDVTGGGERADEVCRRVELIQHATSLGAVESTMERRSVIPGQEHLPPGLLRLSVGIEDIEDLWSDLTQALERK